MRTPPDVPAIPQPRPQRELILDKAVELFAARGFEAMTMRLLGDAVGLDNSSLYRHFSGKTALAGAALDRVAGEVLALIEDQVAQTGPVTPATLETVAADAGGYFFDRPAAARLMLHWIMSMGAEGQGFSASATDTTRPGGRLLEVMQQWLGDGARRGDLRRHATPDAVIILLGAVLLRPATYGYLLASLEPTGSRAAARETWLLELRAAVRGAFAP